MTDDSDFTGRVVVVTGAARGIGLATARAFAERGAQVMLNDIDGDTLEQAASALGSQADGIATLAGDVRRGADVRALMEATIGTFGGLDVVVSNAGIYPYREFLDMAEDEWDRVLDTNLRGTFLVCQAAARIMTRPELPERRRSIVTISSGSYRFARVGAAHYCASKGGAVMLTRVMALELGRFNITVNSIAPGLVDVAPSGGVSFQPSYVEAMTRATPLGRVAVPDDVARVAVLLASPLAAFVTGQVIPVDGGLTAGRYGMPGQSEQP